MLRLGWKRMAIINSCLTASKLTHHLAVLFRLFSLYPISSTITDYFFGSKSSEISNEHVDPATSVDLVIKVYSYESVVCSKD